MSNAVMSNAVMSNAVISNAVMSNVVMSNANIDNTETNDNGYTALNSFMEQFTTINDSLTLLKMQISTIQQHVRTLEKNVKKEMKNYTKEKKNKREKVKREPSGFAKPTMVTKELCEFMNKPEGTKIARTEVTKALTNYIRENQLSHKDVDGKLKIIPDEKLENLLNIDDNELSNLSYFNIQKYMNKHFFSTKLNQHQNSNELVLDA
jgi:hypothetical protein